MRRVNRDERQTKNLRRKLSIEFLETRQLMTAAPLGALPYDTAEFMLGRVAVTPVLLQSNGQIDRSTEDWTEAEINQVLANVQAGMQWWVDTLAGVSDVHELEFIIDDSFARTPFATPYEPISRRSDDFHLYVGQFLMDLGYDSQTLSLDDAIRDFNDKQRQELDTDWSFTIFVVDSSNDPDGQFDHSGTFRQAFAFAGGLFFVTPSGRPASTYAHETGHIFWARDEYPNSGHHFARRGYYNSQNANAIDGAPPGFMQQPSIMSSGVMLQQAFNSNTSAAATLAQIGWQDSNGNGIFDVLDVPLSLNVASVLDQQTGMLRLRGSASAVPLQNRNSSGFQSDITLNRISRLEYRVDGGEWATISSPNLQVALIDVDFPIPNWSNTQPEPVVELRAIDGRTGVTSNVVRVAVNQPSLSTDKGIQGFAFVDENDDSQWSASEELLAGVSLTIVNAEAIRRGRLEPDDSIGTIYSNPVSGLTVRSVGNQVDGRVRSLAGAAGTGAASFNYGSIFGGWGDSWTRIRHELSIEIDVPTSQVSIVAVGKQANSFARLEAYDQSGQLIMRTTSNALAIGQSATLSLFDPLGTIKSIRAFGTAGTSVSLDDFRYGPEVSMTSNVFGTFQLAGLPDGVYTVSLEAPSILFDIVDPIRTVEVMNGNAEPLMVRARAVASPWTNPANALDVNDSGQVQPIDALIIINELNRTGSRFLTTADSTPPFMDVTGDLQITPLDALRIINYLNKGGGTVPAGESSGTGDSSGNSGAVHAENNDLVFGLPEHGGSGNRGKENRGSDRHQNSGSGIVQKFIDGSGTTVAEGEGISVLDPLTNSVAIDLVLAKIAQNNAFLSPEEGGLHFLELDRWAKIFGNLLPRSDSNA